MPNLIERDSRITSIKTQKRGFNLNRGTILSILLSDKRLEKIRNKLNTHLGCWSDSRIALNGLLDINKEER